MSTNYTKAFKIEAVKKVLLRGEGVPLTAVARSLNVNARTLLYWVQKIPSETNNRIPSRGDTIQKSPYNWTSQEKFEAITNSTSLTGEELNEFCRKKGIFPHHLETWKKEFIEAQNKKNSDKAGEIRELKNEIKKLNADLNRKDKALAEAAALLILKKKAQEIWGSNEES